jgi:flagellin
MGFSINTNLYALATENSMNLVAQELMASIGHLSSGLRIQSAADDPAGLAASMALTSQANGLGQASQNTQTALNMAQAASGALNETTAILQRMQTLATQAGNGTNSPTDLTAIQSEMNQLAGQLTEISNSTTFNGHNLLAGGLQNLHFQIGPDGGDTTALSINPMDAASLGVAGSAATLTPGQNNTLISSLSSVGTGLLGASATGEQYQIKATQMTGSAGNNIFTTAGAAGTSGAAAANAGNESMTLAVSGGTYGGATSNFQVQVTSVNASGTITGVQYSTSSSGTPSWTQATVSSGAGGALSFGLGASGISLTFANGAAKPQVGDQFAFTATNGAATAAIQGTARTGTNIGNETTSVSNTYTGTTNLQYAVKATQIDSNNNVVGVEVSTDGGHTFSSTPVVATGYSGSPFAPGTATTFSIGNGLTFTWNQSTFNANQVANNGDTFYFNTVATGQTAQLLQLSDTTQVGGSPKYSGTAANIGPTVMASASQTSATVGIGSQNITANFAAPGASGGLTAGTTAFTVTTPQAATTNGGTVTTPASAPAGLNVMTSAAASAALTQISNALNTVTSQQGQLGGLQNALTDALNVDNTTQTNLTTANSNLVDVNVAQEMVNEARLKIVQQTDIAMLAQANQIPSLVLQLLA